MKVRTHRARDGQKSFIGKLVNVGESGIELDDETSRKRQTIGFDEMIGRELRVRFRQMIKFPDQWSDKKLAR